MELQKIENREFGPGETVELDGKSFLNCAFRGCKVVYGGRQTLWKGVSWQDCEFTFVGSANCTVQVLQAVGCVIMPPAGQTIN
jgi:hypothetical protein